MKTLFEHTSASWIRYSDYEWKEKDGLHYLLSTVDAMPKPYDPMKDAETLIIPAMDIGLMLDTRMMFSLMLTNEAKPLRMCKNCQRTLIAERSNMVFCSSAYRNKFGGNRKN